ncbi:hypothetical protein ACHAXN_001712 [Cyclotella atomus]
MKNFPCSPRTSRQSTCSALLSSSIERSEAMNRRTLSPSMPKGGHVLSIKSSWENRTKLPINNDGSNTRSSVDHRKSNSIVVRQDQKNDGRPSWNRSKTVKTMNTMNRSLYNAHDQENRGDHVNSTHNKSTPQRPMWQERQQTNNQNPPKMKPNDWVKQTDTDETTSLSSHSNEISIGKTLSNISDVSATSQPSNHWRLKSKYNGSTVEYYTSRYDRQGGQLADKLAKDLIKSASDESSSTLHYSLDKISSSDESTKNNVIDKTADVQSRLNYSLERLSEGGEEETYSRPSIGSKYNEKETTADYVVSQEEEESEKDIEDSLLAYVDLSSRLSSKIATVPSTDSSLVYSMGNNTDTDDLKKFTYSYSYDVSEDNPKNFDLVASTLAECRMLLEMSPPPTPLAFKSPAAKRVKSPLAKREVKPFVAKREVEEPTPTPRVPVVASTPRGTDASVVSSPANSSVTSVGLGSFLKCPCCRKEFTNDISDYYNRDRQPLHSFACDHIVCYMCVFASSPSIHMVACPKCGEDKAFDKTKPVVSRSYCNLVKSIEILNSGKKKSAEKIGRSGGEKPKEVKSDGAVPLQIRLSPKKNSAAKREVAPKADVASTAQHDDTYQQQRSRGNARVSFSSMSEITANTTSIYPEEPDTPVSRAEFRFMQRKEKLAQSLEKVNRLLEQSKMNRDELALKSIDEDLSEKKSAEDVSLDNGRAADSALDNETEEIIDTEPNVMKRRSKDDQEQETLNESVRVDGDVVDSAGFERPTIDTLWTDEALCLSQPQGLSAQKRTKPELRVDTGNYTPTPLQRRKQLYLDLKDESTISSVSESQGRSNTISYKVESSVGDIFRGNPTSPQMNFGALENRISSSDSSMTDRDSDNRFLLGNSMASKSGGSSLLKEKKYGLHRPSPLKESKAMSSEKQRNDEHRCPQFLPSLNYSTMQDSDESVGLVREKDGKQRHAVGSGRISYSRSVTPSKLFMKHSRNYNSVRRSIGKAESFDESSLVRNQNQPYEFTQHSCSFSPSSRSLRGALVTHKPRLHKRIIKKLRFRGKSQRLYSRK